MLLDILFSAPQMKMPNSASRLEVPYPELKETTLPSAEERKTKAPELLEGINRNSLLIFLLVRVMLK